MATLNSMFAQFRYICNRLLRSTDDTVAFSILFVIISHTYTGKNWGWVLPITERIVDVWAGVACSALSWAWLDQRSALALTRSWQLHSPEAAFISVASSLSFGVHARSLVPRLLFCLRSVHSAHTALSLSVDVDWLPPPVSTSPYHVVLFTCRLVSCISSFSHLSFIYHWLFIFDIGNWTKLVSASFWMPVNLCRICC